MATKIFTRSPYIVYTGEVTDLSYSILLLYYTGGTSSNPLYTITKNAFQFKDNAGVAKGYNSFDISDLIKDLIEIFYNGQTGLPALPPNVDMTYQLLNFSTTAQLGGTITGLVTGLEGYSEFQDGLNYSLPTNQILLSGTEIYLPNGKTTRIYYNDGSDVLGDETVLPNDTTTDVDGTDIKINRIRECKYPHTKITFLNKWGALQDLWFFKKSIDTTSVSNTNYISNVLDLNKANPSYSTTAHYKKTYNFVGQQKIKLSTGLVGECYNPYLQELMLSPFIWLTDATETYPVVLTSKELLKKTSLNDYLVEYTLDFEIANEIINNIR